MLKKILQNTLLAVLLLAQSCSDDETYDKEKAILAFVDNKNLSISEDLKNIEITIPQEINISKYNSSQNIQNLGIENLSFKPKKTNKFLSKSKKIWSGYRSFYKNEYVFEPIIKNNKIFLLDQRGILWCYDLNNYKKIYKKRIFPRKFIKYYQNPKISYFGNKIFAIAGDDNILAINMDNGEILWQKKILSIPISTPVADKNKVYVITNDNKTYALNSENGDLEWISSAIERPTAIFGAAKPVLYKNMLFSSYSSGEIYALNSSDGKIIWSKSLNQNRAINSDFYLNDIDATPIIRDNILFIVGNGGLMMAINIDNGQYIWKKEIASISDFWAVSGFLFIIDNKNRLITLKQSSGDIKYISQLPDYKNEEKPQSKIIYNSVIMAGNKILISDMSGKFLIVNPQNGKIEQEFKYSKDTAHSPIIVDNKIYIHTVSALTTSLIEIK